MKAEDWNPCANYKDHVWKRDPSNGYYYCDLCGASGWARNYPAGTGWSLNGPCVKPMKCPSCKKLTPFPKALCPTCIEKGANQTTKVKRYRWDDLTIAEQRAIVFLKQRDEPATVSYKNGARSLPSLATKGLVEQDGDCSGQSKWILTDPARKMIMTIEKKTGEELNVSI